MTIKIITINVHGHKRSKVLYWLKSYKPDVVFLQETHLLEDHKFDFGPFWRGHVFLAPGEAHEAGVAIFAS